MTGSPPARLAPLPLILLALALAAKGLACSGKGSSSGLDAGGGSGAVVGAGGSGALGGMVGAGGAQAEVGGRGGVAGNGGAAVAEGGRSGAGGGTSGMVDAGTDGAGPDLTSCPIRSCVQRLVALQAGCAAFGATCVKEIHGAQTNYCLANGVRTYLDTDGVTALATVIKPDGHTCYTVYITYSDTGAATAAIKDPDGTTVLLESDSADDKTITFGCNGVTWVDDRASCGAGGISAFPFSLVDCPKTNGQMCLRP